MDQDNSKQIDAWRGEFGNDYIQRNQPTPDRMRTLTRCFAEIFAAMPGPAPASVFEVGCNIGNNLRAIDRLADCELFGLEPNSKAREALASTGITSPEKIFEGVATELPMPDNSVELAFTSGVLIHIPPADLPNVYREMHRISSRYLLSIEYFSASPETISYRGESDLLFKEDFGKRWLDMFDDLTCVESGFFWKETTGMDNLNWWLFQKS